MNPLTNVKNITKLNEIELASGLIHKKSWHDMYKDSAWIFIGGLEYGLTEGDIIAVFSQYGEVVNLNLVRDKKTGKSKGFCFLCYANQRSTILAVDNLNAIKLCNRTIRVDHVANYKPPKEDDRDDEITKVLKADGCAPKHLKTNENNVTSKDVPKKKKTKKDKKEKKKKKRKHSSSERDSGNQISSIMGVKVKKEKTDSGYDKYDTSLKKSRDNKVKWKNQEGNYEQSLNENPDSHEKFKSKSDQLCHIPSKRDDILYDDKFLKMHRSKQRSEPEFQHREAHKEKNRDHTSLSRKDKRKRSSSSSSDDSSGNHEHRVQYRSEKTQSKNTNSVSIRKRQEYRQDTSSSSDEDSSSQSSTDDEKHKTEIRISQRDKYKSYEEKKSFYKDRSDKFDHRNENSNYTSRKSGHYDKTERDFEYQSKNKYKSNERGDNDFKDTYHRSKYDRR